MSQLKLNFSENCHASDPITSYEAAERVHEFASRHNEIIFHVLLKHGCLTSEEVSLYCYLDRWQVARRLSEMALKGLVLRTKETRKTSTGRNSVIWRIK